MTIPTCLLLICLGSATGCQSVGERGQPRSLFNGEDLSGWDTYLGPAFDSAERIVPGTETGLNDDPLKVFTVVNVDGEPAIRISGERFGGISTREEFGNFHLRLEFRWGEKRWPPREGRKRDSGVLYHAVGDHAADGAFWMRSQEFQVQEGDCGDYWGVAGAMFDITATEKSPGAFFYDTEGLLLEFSEDSRQGRHCIKFPDAEKPTGQWNVVDIYCHGDTAIHRINGTVVMKLFNSRQSDGGKTRPLTRGKFQIQSEGAEVFYRHLTVQDIDRIPVFGLSKVQSGRK